VEKRSKLTPDLPIEWEGDCASTNVYGNVSSNSASTAPTSIIENLPYSAYRSFQHVLLDCVKCRIAAMDAVPNAAVREGRELQ